MLEMLIPGEDCQSSGSAFVISSSNAYLNTGLGERERAEVVKPSSSTESFKRQPVCEDRRPHGHGMPAAVHFFPFVTTLVR